MSQAAYYRFYCVSPHGRFVGVEEDHFETDEEARESARERLVRLAKCRAIEVWRRDVLVCHIAREELNQGQKALSRVGS